jgi:hypothetical protein
MRVSKSRSEKQLERGNDLALAWKVDTRCNRILLQPSSCSAGELTARLRGALDDRPDLVERHCENVVEDEGPRVGAERPRIIRSVVVLPAPFGPRKPVIVPASNENDRSVTAETSPKRSVSDSALTTTVTRVPDR